MGTHTGPTSHWVEQVEESSMGDTYWTNITLG